MQINCPNPECKLSPNPSPKISPIVRNGTFFRKSDSRKISRFFCRRCGTYFSRSTFSPAYYQKKRRITAPLYLLMNSTVSQRRAAKILRVNPKTVVRRFRFLASRIRAEKKSELRCYERNRLKDIQFDDLETSEHTKCKPLSVAIAVDPNTRKIISFQVNQMPARGLLAEKARIKYGYRRDKRPDGWNALMEELVPYVTQDATFTSDENPHYPKFLKNHFPQATHVQVKGGRGSISGQGELKKLKFDPLFSLNHTCAMLRANLNRLLRRTWCTTKNRQGLIDHLSLYVHYHNTRLTRASAVLGGS